MGVEQADPTGCPGDGVEGSGGVTPQGEEYGKNITSPVNQRETQPHWFVDRFVNLLTDLGLPVELG